MTAVCGYCLLQWCMDIDCVEKEFNQSVKKYVQQLSNSGYCEHAHIRSQALLCNNYLEGAWG